MTLGWVALFVVVAAVLWFGLRYKPKTSVTDRTPKAAQPAQVIPAHNESKTTDEVEVQAQRAMSQAHQNLIHPSEGNTLVAIVDTETTGLAAHDEPISIGLLLLEYTSEKGEFVKEHLRLHMLREPSVPIHPQAYAVHSLSRDDLRGKAWDLPALARALISAKIIVAHNAKFDRRMVAKLLPQVGHLQWGCSLHGLSREWSSVNITSRSLDALCNFAEIERPRPHNALTDAIALQNLLTVRTGKTNRSRTLIGALIRNPWSPPFEPETK